MKELQHYINGKWKTSTSGNAKDIINPATQEVIAVSSLATREETAGAVEAADRIFTEGSWSDISPQERAVVLHQIAQKLENHADEIAKLESANNGKTMREALDDTYGSVQTFRYYASLLEVKSEEVMESEGQLQTMTVKEPLGVVSLIVPWNFPLLMSVWKLAPALAAGNSVVIKPAEITPMTLHRLFELLEETDLPKGVASFVMGEGSETGDELATHEKVRMVSFTGSTSVGKAIMKNAADTMKIVSLELGGKSPVLVLEDADIELAVDYSLFGIFMGSGQVCTSGSRLLVDASIYDEFVARFTERAKKIRVGPAQDETSEMGAIVSEAHMNHILEYIERGKQEGATLETGGNRLTNNNLQHGFFLEPTVFSNVTNDMTIAQEEIFGPVVSIIKCNDQEEAISMANDTIYGLAGAVFSKDHQKAMRVIRKVRAGITWVNTYHLTNEKSPWGGYKQSGIGRSLGTYGLEEYQETKQINVVLDNEKINWFDA